MKNLKRIITLSIIIVLSMSCSSDDKKESIADCETKNYGILTVDFGSTETKHGILYTNTATSESRDKIVQAGKSEDTVHLKPGSYAIEISSLNEQNQSLDSEVFQNYSISKCDEKSINVEF